MVYKRSHSIILLQGMQVRWHWLLSQPSASYESHNYCAACLAMDPVFHLYTGMELDQYACKAYRVVATLTGL